MKYITIKLTDNQLNAVHRALANDMMDYSEMYPDYKIKQDGQVAKHNAFLQRIIDSIEKQWEAESQIS